MRLHTVASHWLSPWRTPARAFEPGSYADLVAFDPCVFETDLDDLADGTLGPALTVVGGRATHDPRSVWLGAP